MEIIRNYLEPKAEELDVIKQLKYKPCPPFLGNFEFICYGTPYGYGKVFPKKLYNIRDSLSALVPDQKFNSVFIQRYETGQYVKLHRDPKNNIGYTVLLIMGQFEGAISTIKGVDYQLNNTDALILECTINGRQGPMHEVSKVTSGTRYAFILNTIK
jgi:hypothetical protein